MLNEIETPVIAIDAPVDWFHLKRAREDYEFTTFLNTLVDQDVTIFDGWQESLSFTDKLIENICYYFSRKDDELVRLSFSAGDRLALDTYFMKGIIVTQLDEFYKPREFQISSYMGIKIDYNLNPLIEDNKDCQDILVATRKQSHGIAYGKQSAVLFIY
jgi:hypothetical protein